MMNQPVSPKFHRWLEVFWLSALAAYVVAGAALVPFHGDESTQIFMGRDYFYLFRDGDLSKVLYDRTWTHRPDEQHLRLINGTVSKTIHGWLAASAGMKRDEINGQWIGNWIMPEISSRITFPIHNCCIARAWRRRGNWRCQRRCFTFSSA